MTDEKIVQLYWDRNERALTETAAKYGNYCISIARKILGSTQDAEECVNDTYLQAWKSIPPHRPSVLSAFLGKITRNLSLNRYQRNVAAKRGGGEMSAVLDELAELVSGKENVEEHLHEKELACAIDAFLSALPAEKRRIFVRRYWYTDSISEIADAHGMQNGAVSMILSRLRQKLYDYLTERGFEL